MADAPVIDPKVFTQHLNRLVASLKSGKDDQWGGLDAIALLVGKMPKDDIVYARSTALMVHLVGIQFSNSLIFITPSRVCILASKSMVTKYFTPLQQAASDLSVPLELLVRDKERGDGANFEKLFSVAKAGAEKATVGVFDGVTDKSKVRQGPFSAAFDAAVAKDDGIVTADADSHVARHLAVKTGPEITAARRAGVLASRILKKFFVRKMEDIVTRERKVELGDLSQLVDEQLQNPKKYNVNIPPETLESCFPPSVQSGAQLDFSTFAAPGKGSLSPDVIYCSMGVAHNSYCATVARTFFIDATEEMGDLYTVLHAAHTAAVDKIVHGTSASVVYKAALAAIEEKRSDLVPYFGKNVGHSIGVDLREPFALSAKNAGELREGMVVTVSTYLKGVPLAKGKGPNGVETFSARIADTMRVTDKIPELFTKANVNWENVSYNLNEEEEEEEEEEDGEEEGNAGAAAVKDEPLGRGVRRARSQAVMEEQQAKVARRSEHQTDLFRKRIEEAKRKLERSRDVGGAEEEEEEEVTEVDVYKHPREYPREVRRNRMFVDFSREAVFVPINGTPVPFHISTIKNVTRTDDESGTFLRLNFYVPGASFPKDAPKVQVETCKQNADRIFVKTLSIRCRNSANLSEQFRAVKELQKRMRQRVKQREEEEGLVEQETLVLSRGRAPRLQDVTMRPNIRGRKTQGTIEAHTNGLRFRSRRGDVCDIIYKNIKHALFQPSKLEEIVVLHFHLKNAIMIGKRGYKDVQFYAEVGDKSLALEDKRGNMYDPDEVQEEQRELALRKRLDKLFADFARELTVVMERELRVSVEFQRPYREMGFTGVPSREMVLLQPSADCLVNLTENPPFVLSLDDVEHVHFERIMFSNRNFDMVFIYRDYKRAPLRISAIDMDKLSDIQAWIDDSNITFTQSGTSFNWNSLMADVAQRDDFWLDEDEDGNPKPVGWLFLVQDADGGGDEEDDGEESGSNFSDELDGGEEEAEDEDEAFSDVVADEDEESEPQSEDEPEAEDWEELERKAAEADKRKEENGEAPSRKRGR